MAVTFLKKADTTAEQEQIDNILGTSKAIGTYTPLQAKPSVLAILKAGGPKGSKVKAIKKLRELTGLSLKQAKDLVDAWILDPTTKQPELGFLKPAMPYADTSSNCKPVPLQEAKVLHQRVSGTSPDSIYHTIAVSSHAKLAVRIDDNYTCAIRAECTALAGSVEANNVDVGFRAAGLKQKPNGHYSLHLAPDTLPMAKKTIGAILFGMGCSFPQISDKIDDLVGKGQ